MKSFTRQEATELWQCVVSYEAASRRFYQTCCSEPQADDLPRRVSTRDSSHEEAISRFCDITGWLPTSHSYIEPNLLIRLQLDGLVAEESCDQYATRWTMEAPDRKFPPYSFGRWTKGEEGQPNYRDRIYLNGGILIFADKVWFELDPDKDDGEVELHYTGSFAHPQYTSVRDGVLPARYAVAEAIAQFDPEMTLETLRWSDLTKWAAQPKPRKAKREVPILKYSDGPESYVTGARYRVGVDGSPRQTCEGTPDPDGEKSPF